MSSCNHDCGSCPSAGECGQKIIKAKLNDRSKIKKVIAVLSGKGGVGKSFVTSLLAASLARHGNRVGILDADITGPSIPKAFGVKGPCEGENNLIYPIESRTGIKIMSANLLLEHEDDPIIWRGPMLGNLVKQFYEDTLWEELEYLLIDMPPGTGDVALTIFQMIPVDDLIIITSPQDLVSLIVSKALKMANLMDIHVLGVIENMSYVECPDCNKQIRIYGESHIHEFAKNMGFDVLGQLPIVVGNASKVDDGKVESIVLPQIEELVKKL